MRGGRDATWDIVLATSKDSGATWKRTRLAGDGCAIHMVPNLALDATTGTLHVAYYDSEGAAPVRARELRARRHEVQTARRDQQRAVRGAVDRAPTQKWIGEYQSLVVDDKRRMLHAVWAQPVVESGGPGSPLTSGKPITRMFHAAAKLKP